MGPVSHTRSIFLLSALAALGTACSDDDNKSSSASGGAGGTSSDAGNGGDSTSGGATSGGANPGGATSGGATSGGQGGALTDAGTDGSIPCSITIAGAPTGGPIELMGTPLVDDYGTAYTFGANGYATSASYGDASYTFSQVSNADGWAVGQNSCDDEYGGGKWFLIEWFDDAGALRFCSTVFAADTEADALAADRSDRTNVNEGCAGFAWSILGAPPLDGGAGDGG